ncbi:xylulokinase [Chelativorans intermedius]|uniref:Xylulose kinase n=1 Tax=Chelativorans intermedius TaxID=515947 RepID=A0ABV6D456_9HYPH|nr:xylulokinase [Chelativorans intermedius]MCT8997684.1 xylulokinase [Chelativorans intermedius]
MYLGIDLGTSGVKALVIDEAQTVVASATGALTVSRPHAGWSEQDPADWIRATQEALATLKRSHGKALAAVRGIGLSGQMHGATLLDAADTSLRPCILWNDTRSHEEAAALDADPRFRQITGNIVFPGFTAPKLAWVRRHEPDIFARTARVLLPKDYLRLWLTGEHVSEMSDAAGTAWLDVEKRCWSPQLLAATELGEDHMPRLVEGTEPAGTLRGELADRWGMGRDVVVAGGAGDNAASACGAGTVKPGAAFVSLGTSGVLFAANGAYLPNPESAVHTFCHALPGTWHQMGVILSATDSLNWLSRITGASPAALTGELGETLRAPTGVTFLPYLSGERTPHNDAAIRGSLTGLAHQSDRAALTQAVVEGVAFAFRDSLEALRRAGTTLSRVTAIGGGSRSSYWLKAIATALGLPVDVPAEGDFGAAFGAARLGLVAARGADPLAVCTPPRIAATVEPEETLTPAYEAAYRRYRELYPAIRGATT